MSILRKALTTAAMTVALMAATGAHAETKRIALVVKALGIGFFEAANKGAEEAAKELGDVEIIYTGPTDTTAEGQIEVINSLIAQKVDAIAVSANDTDALVPTLQKAMERGITVISWDSGVAAEGRMMHLNPSSSALIGNTIIKLAADHIEGTGDVAILSATSTSTNQNVWIEEAKKVLPNYPGINLVATVYGDDPADKSYREEGTTEYLHRLEDLVGGLCTCGFVIEDLREPRRADYTVDVAHFGYRGRFIPPYLRIKARRQTRSTEEHSAAVTPAGLWLPR